MPSSSQQAMFCREKDQYALFKAFRFLTAIAPSVSFEPLLEPLRRQHLFVSLPLPLARWWWCFFLLHLFSLFCLLQIPPRRSSAPIFSCYNS